MLGQIYEITVLNIRNIRSRIGSSSVIIVGIAGVVSVLVGLLAMAAGFTATLASSSLPNRAIVMRDGSNGELTSRMNIEAFNIISRMPGIELASEELYVIADIPKKASGMPANMIIRGMRQAGLDIRPELNIVAGRAFEPGKGELIAGVKAVEEFTGLEIGSEVDFRDSSWRVVGHFEAKGGAYESEVWADLAVVQASFRQPGQISTARVLLEEPALAEAIHEMILADPRLELSLQTESQFYASQGVQRAALINTFGYGVAFLMAIGAVFAALNTMYTAVSTRTREIAILRALGFGGVPLVFSVMIEALFLATAGGIIGGTIVYFLFDGYTASTLNNTSFSQIAFDFAVTPELLRLGISWALVLGIIGGLFPAVRAARLPITTALRGE